MLIENASISYRVVIIIYEQSISNEATPKKAFACIEHYSKNGPMFQYNLVTGSILRLYVC